MANVRMAIQQASIMDDHAADEEAAPEVGADPGALWDTVVVWDDDAARAVGVVVAVEEPTAVLNTEEAATEVDWIGVLVSLARVVVAEAWLSEDETVVVTEVDVTEVVASALVVLEGEAEVLDGEHARRTGGGPDGLWILTDILALIVNLGLAFPLLPNTGVRYQTIAQMIYNMQTHTDEDVVASRLNIWDSDRDSAQGDVEALCEWMIWVTILATSKTTLW
jgi:hypothetical protein